MEQKLNMNVNVQGNEAVIRMGKATEPFNYPGTVYKALSTDSFVDIVEARDSEHTIVGYHDTGFDAILDDSIIDMNRDIVIYRFAKSLQFNEWADVLNTPLSQKQLIDFLKCRRDTTPEVPDKELLLYNLQNFKFVQNIEADYSRIDNNNYTFAFKSKDGEGTVQLPQQFTANIDIIKGSNYLREVEIELEIRRPKSADEKPAFILTCPKLARYEEEARLREYNLLMETMDVDTLLVNASLF